MLRDSQEPAPLIYMSSEILWNMKVCMNHGGRGGRVQQNFWYATQTIDRYLRVQDKNYLL